MKRGWTFETLHHVKEENCTRYRLLLYKKYRKGKSTETKQMSDCLGLKVGLETEGKWTRRIFLEWWKYSKYGLRRWLHNYAIYSKALSCTLKTGEFDWMLSVLQDILKWKKKKCSGPSEVLSHHYHCVPSQHTGQRERKNSLQRWDL